MEVKIRSWKKIKKITKKENFGARKYSKSNILFAKMRYLCGKTISLDNNKRCNGIGHNNWTIEPWMCKGGKF